ncbi:MAG TPA: aminotransferase class I/II-fold pyridoxal phosphate-dependent enzyme [Hyphomicrobiaceae bacterium]|jgi:aspartate/methionine/tyrosine aminotransferase|nr:aminotransferase class I/II-fold pyridoxal phosphate-dependent enzyme [Hyphomicrobiaceae bacterium]
MSETRRTVEPPRAPGSERPIASRRSDVPAFIVMDVMQAAADREARGEKVIHMEVGQPGTPAPRAALDAVRRALGHETLGYTTALGTPALRERIARYYAERYGVEVSPQQVAVTTGSSAAFVLAFLALFDHGDRVALPAPGYPCYRHILSALGQMPVPLVTDAASRWMPAPEQLEDAMRGERIAGLVVASPANPTGTMLEPERLRALAAACRRLGVRLVSDEIYHGLTYGMVEQTALACAPDAVVINSFSKYFSMTGWRVGWLVVPPSLVRPIERLAQNLYISPPAPAQVAALGAFDGIDELEANKRVYAENRALLLKELPAAGLERILPPDGAFYLYADISDFSSDSVAFTKDMLAEIGIAATPGVDFDAERGSRYVRFCYAGTTGDMAEAARRLKGWRRLQRAGR